MPQEKEKERKQEPNLPPAGDARRDELKRREDDLQRQVDELSATSEIGAIDPRAFEVDREIAHHYDPQSMSVLSITNPRPEREYCWTNFVSQHGSMVWLKKAEGWQVVQGDDPECRDSMSGADTTRRRGDLILMWISKARKASLDQIAINRAERQRHGIVSELHDHAARTEGKIIVHDPDAGDTSKHSRHTRTVGTASETLLTPRQQAIVSEAKRNLGEALRNEIPGLPIPGRK